MIKRTVHRWARQQYTGNVQPWPRWSRWSLGIGVLVIVALKIAGVL